MGFLAPAFLALAVLAGVPLLVHLLRRKVGKSFSFPAVRYLLRMEQEHHRDVQLKNRILLLLRLVAVLAIALAAARPVTKLLGRGHSPVAVAVVIDNSASSGVVHDGRQVFAGLRDEVSTLLDHLDAADRLWVVSVDGRVRGGRSEELREYLAELAPLGGRGDPQLALERAIGLARSGAPRVPIVAMVSDGQRSSLRVDSVAGAGKVPVVVLASPQSAVVNRSVLEVSANPVRWTPGGAVSFSIAAPDSAAWRVNLDGRTVSRGFSGPGSLEAPSRVTQRLASSGSGWMRGSVELEADALRADDSRWFAVLLSPPPQIRVASEAGPFLEAAISTLADEARVTRLSSNRSVGSSVAETGGPRRVSVGSAEASGASLPALLFAPADPLSAGEANRRLEQLGIPWRFGAVSRGQVMARTAMRTASDSTSLASRAFNGMAVRLHYPLVFSPGTGAVPDVDTIATASGRALVVSGADYVLAGFAVDPDITDLPIRASFVPWLTDVLTSHLGGEGRLIEATPGEVIDGLRGVTALESPGGATTPISGDRVTVPAATGVYFLRANGKRVGAVVVNGETSESNMSMLNEADRLADDSAELRSLNSELLPGMQSEFVQSGAAWREAIFSHAPGQSLVLPLLAMALLALLAESWIAGRQ